MCVVHMLQGQATYSNESFSSSSHRSGSLCRPRVMRRASTCSFSGLYSSCSRRVDSSSLFRSFSDCLMVFSIWNTEWLKHREKTPRYLMKLYMWVDNSTISRAIPIYSQVLNLLCILCASCQACFFTCINGYNNSAYLGESLVKIQLNSYKVLSTGTNTE